MEVVSLHEFNSIIKPLKAKVEELESEIKKLKKEELDKQKVLTKEEACKIVRLSISGINDARRNKRIKGTKINEKEWGYTVLDCENYLKRYCKIG